MRIANINIPNNKHLSVALTAVYGVGRARAALALKQAGIEPSQTAATLSTEQEATIRQLLEAYTLEGNLKREIAQNIKRLKDINSYRGGRHSRNLPVRGQRTKTNSRTVRGNKRSTMGSGRVKVSKT